MKNFNKFGIVLPFLLRQVGKGISYRVFLFAATLLLFAASFEVSAQSQSDKINLEFKDASLAAILKSITKQTGYTFMYSDDVPSKSKITVSVKDGDLNSTIKKVLENTGIGYKVEGNRIVLFKAAEKANSQQKVVIKVFDSKMNPLPGATINYKNGDKGAITDKDGLAGVILRGGESVKVSFIGFKSHDFLWNGQKEVVVKLAEDSRQFDEVIITGFSTISKERSTGSVSVIKSEDFSKRMKFSLSSYLEGQVAGLNSYKGSTTIRGTTSFLSSAQPLVVVDGLPIDGSLNDVNPNDVESINVLKDAASASIYGTRAANGIIVVTTKSAEKGKLTFNFAYSLSMTPRPSIDDYNYASTSDIIDYEVAGLENNPDYKKGPLNFMKGFDTNNYGYSPIYQLYYDEAKGKISADDRKAAIEKLRKYDYRREFAKLFWQNRITHQYSMSVGRGNETSNMNFSANFQDWRNGDKNSDGSALTLNFKNSLKMGSRINLTYGAYGYFTNSDSRSGYGGATSAMPYSRILDDDGNRVQIVKVNPARNEWLVQKGLYDLSSNPIDEMERNFYNFKSNRFRAFTDLNIKLFEGLSYGVKFQYEKQSNKSATTYLKNSFNMRYDINRFAEVSGTSIVYNVPKGGRYTAYQTDVDNYTLRNQLDYKKQIGKLSIEAFTGYEFRQYKTEGFSTDLLGYDPDITLGGQAVNWEKLRAGVYGAMDDYYYARMYSNAGSSYLLNRELSTYMNGSFSYSGKYILAGSWRVDKANMFGVDTRNRFRPLWSVSGSWNVSSEEFMKRLSWLQNLKLRASYGTNGNVDRNSSPYLLANFVTADDVEGVYANVSTPPNRTLRWEKTEILNLGVDFRVLNNKLYGSVDLYNKYTTDLIVNSILDYSSGYESAKFNNGEMSNRGVEVSLGYSWLSNDDWDIDSRVVFAYNKNRIEKINFKPSAANYQIMYPTSYFREGDSYNTIYSYRYAGLTANGDPSVYDKNGKVVENSAAMSDPEALVNNGNYTPTMNGSFSQSVRYKGFVLDMNFVMYAGHKLRLDVTPLYGYTASASMSEDISKRWTPENTNTDVPRFPVYNAAGSRADFWKYADKHIVSSDMVKLRSLSLAYNLSPRLLSKIRLKSLQVKAQVNNLWYWSAAGHGIDPENFDALNGTRSGANIPSYLLGLNFNF